MKTPLETIMDLEPFETELRFGEVVRERRKSLGISLQALGDRVGLHKGYLSMIERGKRSPPSAHWIDCIERALDYESGELAEIAWWDTAPEDVKSRIRLKGRIYWQD